MKNNTLLLLIVLVISQFTLAQPGKNEYLEAKKLYDSGSYLNCLQKLDKVQSILGESNAVIEHLRVKTYFELKQYDDSQKALVRFYKYPASPQLVDEMNGYKKKILLANLDEPLAELRKEKRTLENQIHARINYIDYKIDSIQRIENRIAVERLMKKAEKEIVLTNLGPNEKLYLKPDGTFYLVKSNIDLTPEMKRTRTYWNRFFRDVYNLKEQSNFYLKLNTGSVLSAFSMRTVSGSQRLKPNYLYKSFNYDLYAGSDNVAIKKATDNKEKFNGTTYFEDLREYKNDKPKTSINVYHGNWGKTENMEIHLNFKESKEIFPAQVSKLQYDTRGKGFYCSKYKNPPYKVESVESSTGIKLGYTEPYDVFDKTEPELVWASLNRETKLESRTLQAKELNSSIVVSENQVIEDYDLDEVLTEIDNAFKKETTGTLQVYSSNNEVNL